MTFFITSLSEKMPLSVPWSTTATAPTLLFTIAFTASATDAVKSTETGGTWAIFIRFMHMLLSGKVLIPVSQPYLDPLFPIQSTGKDLQVLTAIVIGIDDLGTERLDTFRCFLGSLGVGKIHAEESDIDPPEGLDLRNALRVPRKIDAFAPKLDHVAVSAPRCVIELARAGSAT